MKTPDPVGNNLLAFGAYRCNSLPGHSMQIGLQKEKVPILRRGRTLGFSGDAKALCTIAWTVQEARLAAEGHDAPDLNGLIASRAQTSPSHESPESHPLLRLAFCN
jgi:hypothetical protein